MPHCGQFRIISGRRAAVFLRLFLPDIFDDRIHDALGRGMSLKRAIETAMDSCIEEGILKDVLIRQKTEVMHMLLTEFDEKKYKRSVYQDGYEDGVREGEISGFTKGREDALRDLARKKAAQGKDMTAIAAELETDIPTVERLLNTASGNH